MTNAFFGAPIWTTISYVIEAKESICIVKILFFDIEKNQEFVLYEPPYSNNGALWIYQKLLSIRKKLSKLSFFSNIQRSLDLAIIEAKTSLYDYLREEKKKASAQLNEFLNSVLVFLFEPQALQTFIVRYHFVDLRTTEPNGKNELIISKNIDSFLKSIKNYVNLYPNYHQVA